MQRNLTEKIVKKFLLAVALTSTFASGAIAQSAIPPRDPPFGKGMGNDTPQQSAGTSSHLPSSWSQNIPPRDPPFGKGNADNDTLHQPSSADIWHWR